MLKSSFLDMYTPIEKSSLHTKSSLVNRKLLLCIVIISIVILLKLEKIYFKCEYLIIIGISLMVCAKMRYQEGSICFINKKLVLHLPFIGFFKIIRCSKIVDIGYTNCMINPTQIAYNYHHIVKEYIYISTIPVDLKILANLFVRHWKNRHIIIVSATEHNIEVLTKEYGFKINKKYRNKLTYENYGNYIYGKKQFEEIKKRPF